MRRIIIISGTLLALAGCATPQQMVEWDAQRCHQWGFEQGSTEYGHCMMEQDIARRERFQQMLSTW